MWILYSSAKNMRKNIETYDDLPEYQWDLILRTSYLGELEIKFCIALNCIGMQVGENSSYFNLMLDYVEFLYDKWDVVFDLLIYFQIMLLEDINAFTGKIDEKIE